MFPTEQQWQNPAMRPWLEKLNKGAVGEPYDRIKIARVIRDLYLTDWGSRLFMFENFNGTPLSTLLSLTMKRAEFSGAGPIAEFARKVVGLGINSTLRSDYESTVEYARAQDSGRRATAELAVADQCFIGSHDPRDGEKA
jgi:4-hydroxyphenylacetate 3-monooxygenase/chlorophenol-4-monooxygenase component 2